MIQSILGKLFVSSTKSIQGNTLKNILDLEGIFYWSYRDEYFIETKNGNFVWSCPSRFGNNSIKRYEGALKQWCKENEVPCTKNEGKKVISQFVGDDVTFIEG